MLKDKTESDHKHTGVTLRGVDCLLIALVMCLMDGFFWAVRGTGGFG